MQDYKPAMKPMPIQRCRHINCKGLMVYGAEYKTPEDESARTNGFWCEKTQSVIGPDGFLVLLNQCDPNRPCYQEL